MRALATLLIFGCATTAFAGWTNTILPKDDRVSAGRAIIEYVAQQEQGERSFRDALESLVKNNNIQRLDLVTLHWLVDDAAFQGEVLSALEELAPKEFVEAQHSAGNMHNPKMIQLRKPFQLAVLATPTVKNINSALASFGLHVLSASHEKLMFVGKKDQRRLKCFLWLTVTKSKLP